MWKRAAVFTLVCLTQAVMGQSRTYIALGDSVGWGYQPNDINRGPGDKGYVKPFADWLKTQQGNVRPNLYNFSVPGETSSSFFDTSEIGAILNSNYPLFGRKSQASMFSDRATVERNAGRTVTHITFALGGNDLLEMLTPEFLSQPFDMQKAQIDQKLILTEQKLTQALTLIRQQLPSSMLIVPGYYNPYGAYPGSPENQIALYAIPKLNELLRAKAAQYTGYFSDVYPHFVGRELELTWIGEDDIHPRSAGYAVIGVRVIFTGKKSPRAIQPRP